MDSRSALFRPEALAAQGADGCGAIVLACPVSLMALSGTSAAMACGLAALLYFGTYTAHSTLRGRVMPEWGVIEIASPQAGRLVEKRIVEGQHVAAGEVLYVVSSERVGGSGSATQAAIGEQLARRRSSLIEQIDSTRALETVERDALAKRLATLRTEMAKFDDVLATHAQRLDLLTATAERRRRLRDLGFLSEDQWRAAEADLLDQRGRLRSLDRERAAAERVRAELEGLAASLGLEYANALAELTRAVAATDLEIAENDARRGVVVTAPRAGTVTAVAAQVGQPVEAALPLGFIVPIDAVLIAELYAPSRAVGFVAPGAEVRLRYAAFPYQKFGHARGIVATISQTTLATFDSSRQETRSEPLYRVVVTLEAQTVSAYGEARRLLPGMEVEADVLQETRRLYEWVLEPLYAMAARLDR